MPFSARKPVALPVVASARLTSARLRQPTPLPTVVATTKASRWLLRLNWLFGGSRR